METSVNTRRIGTSPFAVGAAGSQSIGDASVAIPVGARYVVTNTALSAARTWTLPPACAYPTGSFLIVYDQANGVTATNTLTLQTQNSDTLNGGTTLVMRGGRDYETLISDGRSTWQCDRAGSDLTFYGATLIGNSGSIGFSATASSPDGILSRLAAGSLMLSNGTNGTKFSVSSTTDSLTSRTNYADAYLEAGTITSGQFSLGSEAGGTGTALTSFALYANGVIKLDYNKTTSNIWTSSATINIGTTSGAFEINGDTILSRNASATWQHGAADGSSPVAQTIRFQGGAGTNVAGANATIIGSLSTGTANSGDIIFQTGVKPNTSGTTQATATTALTIKGETQNVNFAALIGTNGYAAAVYRSGQNAIGGTNTNGAVAAFISSIATKVFVELVYNGTSGTTVGTWGNAASQSVGSSSASDMILSASAGRMYLASNGNNIAATIDTSQRFLIGYTADQGGGQVLQVNGTATFTSQPTVNGTALMLPNTTATLTVGYTVTSYSGGTISSGTFTPAAANGNTQYITNGGAFTLAAPAADCVVIALLVTNNSSAGTITFSGFTVGANTGDTLDTQNNHKFMIVIRRVNGVSTYFIQTLQIPPVPVLLLAAKNSLTGTSISFSGGGAISSGDLVVLQIGEYYAGATGSISSISDGTNSYTKAILAQDDSNALASEIWYCANCTAVASPTWTINTSALLSGANTLIAARIPSMKTSGVLDKTGSAAAGGGNSFSISSGTLSQAYEILFGGVSLDAPGTITLPTGWTQLGTTQSISVVNSAFCYKIVSATTSVTFNPTWTSGTFGTGTLATFEDA